MPLLFLTIAVRAHAAQTALVDHLTDSLTGQLTGELTDTVTDGAPAGRHVRRWRDETGQATTEYALVLLAAALVALLVVAWATAGGGAAKISQLFNKVIDSVTDRV